MTGIMPLTRELGEILDLKPIEETPMIAGPTRPSRGRWPKEQWELMQSIYNAPDPCAQPE